MLVFCVPLLREAAYELWPERQRVALHRKCAAFLERHAHKCKSCSQGDFVAFHRFTVTSTQEGGSSQGPAEQGDPHSWEALVLAGEQLKRDRTHTPEGMLCTMLHSLGPPGPQGGCAGDGVGGHLLGTSPGGEDGHCRLSAACRDPCRDPCDPQPAGRGRVVLPLWYVRRYLTPCFLS